MRYKGGGGASSEIIWLFVSTFTDGLRGRGGGLREKHFRFSAAREFDLKRFHYEMNFTLLCLTLKYFHMTFWFIYSQRMSVEFTHLLQRYLVVIHDVQRGVSRVFAQLFAVFC